MKTDLIVIGGGPAGLLAAKTAAEQGLSVTLIEKSKSYDKILRACSMQFILDDDYEGEGVVVNDGNLYFPKSNFSVPYHGKLVPVLNKYYHSPKDHIIHFALDDGKTPFSFKFDKAALLRELYQACCSLGVTLILDALATNVTDYGSYVEVSYRSDSNISSVCSRKLIIAEGVNSALCTKCGLNQDRPHVTTALCQKYYLKGLKGIEPGSWNLFYGRAYQSNAALIIGPSLLGDDIFELTISGDKNHLPADIFEAAKKDSPLSDALCAATVIDSIGCGVKAYMAMSRPYKCNVLAIGDAAAFVEVEVQGALLCGHHAANAVYDELKGEAGFEKYTRWWLDAFEFNRDDYLRVSQGYALVPVYSDDELDYLFALIEKECLTGTYSQYKTPKLIWDAILTHGEQIKKEAPQIYEKILKNNQLSLAASFCKD